MCYLYNLPSVLIDNENQELGNDEINEIIDKVLFDVEYNTIENEIITFLRENECITKTERNFLIRYTDAAMKMDIVIIFLKSILKWHFYKFCNFLKESSSQVAQIIGSNLIFEANKAIKHSFPGKNKNLIRDFIIRD